MRTPFRRCRSSSQKPELHRLSQDKQLERSSPAGNRNRGKSVHRDRRGRLPLQRAVPPLPHRYLRTPSNLKDHQNYHQGNAGRRLSPCIFPFYKGRVTELDYTTLKRNALTSFFSRTNEMQRRAVFRVKGAVLIIAGAGSGKTTVLCNRIANMMRFGNAYLDETVRGLTSEQERFSRISPRWKRPRRMRSALRRS